MWASETLGEVVSAYGYGAVALAGRRFALFNGAGGASWPLAFGAAAYLLGNGIHRAMGPIGIATVVLAACAAAAAVVLVRRRQRAWEDEALRADRADHGRRPPPSARNS